MAHFAELDDNNIVIRVIVVNNEDCSDEYGIEHEQLGIDFCTSMLGGRWVQTSYNRSVRKNYAGIGYMYDGTRDAFIAQQPFPSWLLDEDTCRWYPPSPRPEDGKAYNWDETTLQWVELEEPQ